jgi:hypothetical protein
MPRRPLLAAVTLSTLTLLTACHGSPEAGRPNTPPPPRTPATTNPTPTPTAPSTPTWTPAERAAITAAKSRYLAALNAIDKSLNNPTVSSRVPLEAAGLGDKRILDAIGDVRTLRESGWYRAGKVQVRSLTPLTVDLNVAHPQVTLQSCVDLSATVLRYQKDDKVVPVGASSSKRVSFSAVLRYGARSATSAKMWFLTDEKANGSC